MLACKPAAAAQLAQWCRGLDDTPVQAGPGWRVWAGPVGTHVLDKCLVGSCHVRQPGLGLLHHPKHTRCRPALHPPSCQDRGPPKSLSVQMSLTPQPLPMHPSQGLTVAVAGGRAGGCMAVWWGLFARPPARLPAIWPVWSPPSRCTSPVSGGPPPSLPLYRPLLCRRAGAAGDWADRLPPARSPAHGSDGRRPAAAGPRGPCRGAQVGGEEHSGRGTAGAVRQAFACSTCRRPLVLGSECTKCCMGRPTPKKSHGLDGVPLLRDTLPSPPPQVPVSQVATYPQCFSASVWRRPRSVLHHPQHLLPGAGPAAGTAGTAAAAACDSGAAAAAAAAEAAVGGAAGGGGGRRAAAGAA